MINTIIPALKKSTHSIVNIGSASARKAWFTANAFAGLDRPVIVVLPDQKSALSFMDDLSFFMPQAL